jgi:integrase
VPISPEDVETLRKLKVKTLKDGGPFVGLARDLDDAWAAMLKAADLKQHITPHDLRRTFCTRLVRAEVPLPTVQRLAGHSTIQTTLSYYNAVTSDDLQRGMEKLWKAQRAG